MSRSFRYWFYHLLTMDDLGAASLLSAPLISVLPFQKPGTRGDEPYTNYYGDVIAAVTSLKDIRSLNALLGALTTGNMVMTALAELGADALDPVIEKLNSHDTSVRQAATIVLVQMLEPMNFEEVIERDPFSRWKIKQALLKAARDEYFGVRKSAVGGLAVLGDQDIIGLIEKLAKEDPYQASEHGGQRGYYPVRETAHNALQKIKLREHPDDR